MDRPRWYPRGNLAEPYVPKDQPMLVLEGMDVSHLMPPVEAIPEEFGASFNFDHKAKKGPEYWLRFQDSWFFHGLDPKKIRANEGVNKEVALRHLAAIQGSFQPKHEYKAAAVAYLASLWFKSWGTK